VDVTAIDWALEDAEKDVDVAAEDIGKAVVVDDVTTEAA
jgi:hypothetical protein